MSRITLTEEERELIDIKLRLLRLQEDNPVAQRELLAEFLLAARWAGYDEGLADA